MKSTLAATKRLFEGPEDSPLEVRLIAGVSIVIGTPVLLYSLYQARSADSSWLFLAVATFLASLFPVRLPLLKGRNQSLSVTASDIFVFAALLLFSPEVAVTVAAIDCFMGSYRSRRFSRVLFNTSQVSLVTFTVGRTFYYLYGQAPPLRSAQVDDISRFLLILALACFVYFATNSAAVAWLISRAVRSPFLGVWKEHFLWAALTNFTGVSVAVVIFFYYEQTQFFAVGLALPVILIMLYAYRMNHARLQTLQESGNFLQSTLDSLSSAIAILDESGQIIAVNAGWRAGNSEGAFFGPAWSEGCNYREACEKADVTDRERGCSLAKGIREVTTGRRGSYRMEYSIDGPGGKFWHTVAVTRFQGKGPVRVVVAIDNITELKQVEAALRSSEEQLRQSQKMEAIGNLAGGVAHDFNNVLTVISGYCDISLLDLKESSPLRQNILEIKAAAQRAGSLTGQLLAFSRKQVLQPRILDINALVLEMERMLHRLIGEDIRLILLPASNLDKVKADPGQLEQVILNLVVNARDAMPGGGKITIETANISVASGFDAGGELNPGSYVMLSVRDTGCGIDESIRSRIFEPFFTTKTAGKGTGLGLSTVYGIVKQSGGGLTVSSRVGIGSEFRIYLPRVAGSSETPAKSEKETGMTTGSETILLAEDEASLRKLTRRILETQGYSVLEAQDGVRAIQILRRHDGPIHLLLTDIVMPQMGGLELAQQITSQGGKIKVIFMSGYAEKAIHPMQNSNWQQAFLSKPFTTELLTRTVRRVLDS